MEKFSSALHEKIKNYVYLLIDPRDNTIFYVGKGYGNRVFDHAKGAFKGDPVHPAKNELIREIINSGHDVVPMIARWELTEDEAYTIESILIDLFTNPILKVNTKMKTMVKGHNSSKNGLQTPKQVEEKLTRGPVDMSNLKHKLLAISLKDSLEGPVLYERVRGNWNLNPQRANKADYVLAVRDGVIIGIFQPEKDSWKVVEDEKIKDKKRQRVNFTGKEVEDPEIIDLYLHKTLPKKAKGNSNPIHYFF